MSDDENSISSQTSYKLSNVTNKMYTSSPCRRVGLKRKSGVPFHNILKKTNTLDKTKKSIEFDKNVIINTESKDKFISILNCKQNKIQKSKVEKQREIEELKSEIKNSKQVRKYITMVKIIWIFSELYLFYYFICTSINMYWLFFLL